MTQETPQFDFNRCPTCTKPLPCILHDKEFEYALFKQKPPSFPVPEKTDQSWEYGNIIYFMTPLSDTQVFIGGVGGKIKLLDITTKELTDIGEYGNTIYSMTPLSDSTVLIGGWGGKIKLLNITTKEIIDIGEYGYGNNIRSMAPLSDSTVLIGGYGGKIELWKVSEEKLQAYQKAMLKKPVIPPLPEMPRV